MGACMHTSSCKLGCEKEMIVILYLNFSYNTYGHAKLFASALPHQRSDWQEEAAQAVQQGTFS